MEFMDLWNVNFHKTASEGDRPRVECHGCGEHVPGESINEGLPDAGLSIDFEGSGYYGGFVDNHPWETDPNKKMGMVNLCHGCVSRMMSVLPALAKRLGNGHHPSLTEDKPCCPHSWTSGKGPQGEDITLVPDDNGGWMPDPDEDKE